MNGIGKWFAAHPLRPAFAALAFIALAGLSGWAWRAPRLDRVWDEYLMRTPHVELRGDGFAVTPVTQWTYVADGPVTRDYSDAHFAFADLRNVWFVVEPQPGMDYAAHTFLLFEFAGDRLLGVTIEARREAGEQYSAVAGAFNEYELDYVWGGARDLLTRRAVMLKHQVYVYPIAITEAQKQTLLRRLLQRTQELETRPRFYNTFFSNCTNELAKATELHWDASYVLTGYAAQHLHDIHLIPGADFAADKQRADMAAFIRALNANPPADFDAAILRELRFRNANTAPASAAPPA